MCEIRYLEVKSILKLKIDSFFISYSNDPNLSQLIS